MARLSAARPIRTSPGDSSSDEAPTDEDLLSRWVAGSDAAALDILIRRHGTMVLGVCRRVLGNTPDADDAFQATFLILVRRAGSLKYPGEVAGWLHGVALRVSRRMRADLARRWRREEAMATDPPAPVPSEDPTDLRRILDEELDRLPDKYRLPIVLCELEGLTLDEAARRLGWPKGTVAGRLSRGRDLLRRRLSRRPGLVVPKAMVAGPSLLGLEGPTGDLPEPLVSATIEAAASPDGPTAQAAAAIGDAIARDAAARKWLGYVIAILIAIILSVAGLQAQAIRTGTVDAAASGSGGCHSPSP